MTKTKIDKINDASVDNEDEDSNDDKSSDFVLELSQESKENIKKIITKSGRIVKKRSSSESSESSIDFDENEEFDHNIERTITSIARKNSLSELTVRKILRKVVRNDHVLALVKIKEEEEDSKMEEKNDSDEEQTTPITRLKAKELNQNKLPMKPINPSTSTSASEVAMLINSELHSDEEDEEYQPGEDDIGSDDEGNTTISDIDSQPRTPHSAFSNQGMEHDFSPQGKAKFSQDGIFKIPQLLPGEQLEIQTEEEIIARRTRSKVCLQSTPIETIESTFIPPDITTDMYDFDCDIDNVWKEFLNEFTMPLNSNENDDDEADPEYVAEKVIMDKEELRGPIISKKEVNDLIKEFCDIIGFLDIDDSEVAEQLNTPERLETPTKPKPSPRNKKISSKPSTSTEITESTTIFSPTTVSTPSQPASNHVSKISQVNQNTENSTIAKSIECSSFGADYQNTTVENQTSVVDYFSVPNQLPAMPAVSINEFKTELFQTPQKSGQPIFISDAHNNVYQVIQIPNVATPLQQIPTSQYYLVPTNNLTKENQTNSIFIQSNQSNTSNNSTNNSLTYLPSSNQSTPLQQPIQHQSSKNPIESIETDSPVVLEEETCEFSLNLTDDNKSEQVSRSSHVVEKRYAYLNDLKPVQKHFDPRHKGFTLEQRNLLDHQLRMHVQLCTQNYAQTYGHPQYYKFADQFRKNLSEFENKMLENKENHQSVYNIINLSEAIIFCDDWVNDLAENTKENQKYLKILNDDVEKRSIKKKWKYYGPPPEIPKKLRYKIIESKVFMYPLLLPKCGFAAFHESKKGFSFTPGEDFVIAQGLERFYDELAEKSKKFRSKGEAKITLNALVHKIAKNICLNRSPSSIFNLIRLKNLKRYPMNPIKYFNKHKKAPPVNLEIGDIDLSNIKAPKDYAKGTLGNKLWEKYIYSKDRIGRLRNDKLVLEGKPKEYIPSDEDDDGLLLVKTTPHHQSKSITSQSPVIKIVYNTVNNFEYKELLSNSNKSLNNLKTKKQIDTLSTQSDALIESCGTTLTANEYNKRCVNNLSDLSSESDSLSFTSFPISTKSLCSCCVHSSDDANKSKLFNYIPPKGQKLLTDYFTVAIRNTSKFEKEEFCNKISDILSSFRVNYVSDNNINPRIHLYILLDGVYSCLKELDIYINLLLDIKMGSTSTASGKITNSSNNGTEQLNPMLFSAKPIFHRNLTFEEKEDKEKDKIYAQNFYEKVKESFTGENIKDFDAFHKILIEFDYDNDSVPELYYKMEKLFYPKYPELAEIFLTFLLPGHAAQVGKFFEHFMMTNMGSFISKLNVYYSRQPAQIRKIYSCLNDLALEKNLTMESLKLKILPLLKGNQILTDWFLQLFPPAKPNESTSREYEILNVSKFQNDEINEYSDGYEKIPTSDIFPDSENINCGLKYIQGRIFCGNRILLPAKLSFLACVILPSEDSSVDPKLLVDSAGGGKPVECVHDVNFNDRPTQENHNSDNELNSSHSSEEIDFEENQRKRKRKDSSPSSDNETKPDLCDENSFKAHSVRLNPLIHRNKVDAENYEIMSGTREDSSDSPIRNSPKRQFNIMSSINSNSKNQKKPFSPNSKKLNKSPNFENVLKKEDVIPVNSPALATARKISNMINDDIDDDDRPLSERLKEIKQKRISRIDDSGSDGGKSVRNKRNRKKLRKKFKTTHTKLKQEDIGKNEQNKTDEIDSGECKTKEIAIKTEEEISPKKISQWTRDEDKIILEAIENDFTDESDLIEALCESLEQRTIVEIVERYEFLMDVLKQFSDNS